MRLSPKRRLRRAEATSTFLADPISKCLDTIVNDTFNVVSPRSAPVTMARDRHPCSCTAMWPVIRLLGNHRSWRAKPKRTADVRAIISFLDILDGVMSAFVPCTAPGLAPAGQQRIDLNGKKTGHVRKAAEARSAPLASAAFMQVSFVSKRVEQTGMRSRPTAERLDALFG